ncbi:hypothetical protein [Amycolatopsis anabasis]|uniref:bestrophin-like domain n=1 Tax=Amycolatopsis anabasis TaxID=1840409 RepID=UPI00131C00A6|nr:hypothetical protein [Amycolatopsis anabasis]
MVVTVVAVGVALVIGLLANHFHRKRMRGEDTEAITIKDLTSPLETLAVLVLAFVLVTAAESYNAAEDAARVEAHALDHFFEVADYAPAAQRERIKADAVCYARAVHALEWPAMAEGRRASEVSFWANDFNVPLREMDHTDTSFEILVDADKSRDEGRGQRVAESRPAIPDVVYWFMLLTLAITIMAFAFALPRRRKGAEVAGLAVITMLLTLSLLLIRDVDRPIGGIISVEPYAMAHQETDLTVEFTRAYGQGSLPCDEQGRKLLE